MISFKNFAMRRGERLLLSAVDLTLHAGWRTGVVGRNGTGKSTLLAVLAGLLINVGRKGEQREYQGTRGTRFEIAPGSACSDPKPRWVMAGEIVRTTRVLARTVASVRPDWIERAAAHLVRRSYTDPRWDPATGRVLADEKVVFEGLELVARRAVHYGPIDPAESRRIFIHHALVEGDAVSARAALWISALIVGAVVALIGAVMLMNARRKIREEGMTPRRTARSIRETTEWMRSEVAR